MLARCGFVVVSARLPSTGAGQHPSTNEAEVALLDEVVEWMRTEWVHASTLGPDTGFIGHSYGGLLGGRFAAEGSSAVSAFASLGSAWTEWAPGVFPSDSPLPALAMPRLFEVGDVDRDGSIAFSSLSGTRHLTVLAGTDHWDFLPQDRSACNRFNGTCEHSWALAGDLAALFFGKYLPLEYWPNLGSAIADSLTRAPKRKLSFAQWFYSSGHLASLALLKASDGSCGVSSKWVTPGGTGSVTRP